MGRHKDRALEDVMNSNLQASCHGCDLRNCPVKELAGYQIFGSELKPY